MARRPVEVLVCMNVPRIRTSLAAALPMLLLLSVPPPATASSADPGPPPAASRDEPAPATAAAAFGQESARATSCTLCMRVLRKPSSSLLSFLCCRMMPGSGCWHTSSLSTSALVDSLPLLQQPMQ
jgi:hypothetical protein